MQQPNQLSSGSPGRDEFKQLFLKVSKQLYDEDQGMVGKIACLLQRRHEQLVPHGKIDKDSTSEVHERLEAVAKHWGFDLGCSAQTITRVRTGKSQKMQMDRVGRLVLALSLDDEVNAMLSAAPDLQTALQSAFHSVSQAWKARPPPPEALEKITPERSPVQSESNDLVHLLTENSPMQHNRMINHFMGDSTESLEAYFLVYRYSTTGDALVKSFMVIRKSSDTRSAWTFMNAVKGVENEDANIHREATGVVCSVYNTYYLLALTYKAGASHQISLTGEIELREKQESMRRGIISMAIEHAALDTSTSLPVSALIMSIAAQAQPIVARAAIIRLGIREPGNSSISENDIQLGQIPITAIADDLADTIGKLKIAHPWLDGKWVRKLNTKRRDTPITLNKLTFSFHPDEDTKMLGEHVLAATDNLPAAEIEERGELAPMRGALETYANKGRPRE